MSDQGSSLANNPPRAYDKPRVMDLGSVAEVTESTFGGCNTDNGTCCIPAYS
jgi:hypothetical protein